MKRVHKNEAGENAPEEDAHRAVFAACLPAARLAAALDLDGRALKTWVELALFQEFKNAGLSLVDIAKRLEISERKAQQLNKKLRENFMALHKAHELPRRIEFLLWSGPLTLARLKQIIKDADSHEVERALFELEDKGRVVRKRHDKNDADADPAARGVVFEIVSKSDRRTGPTIGSRIDAMRNFCSSVCNTIYSRFFGSKEHAFARTVGFRIRASKVPELEKEYEAFFQKLVAFEQDAESVATLDDNDNLTLDLSICWAPYDEAAAAVVSQRKEEK